jgi:hypothetical protein
MENLKNENDLSTKDRCSKIYQTDLDLKFESIRTNVRKTRNQTFFIQNRVIDDSKILKNERGKSNKSWKGSKSPYGEKILRGEEKIHDHKPEKEQLFLDEKKFDKNTSEKQEEFLDKEGLALLLRKRVYLTTPAKVEFKDTLQTEENSAIFQKIAKFLNRNPKRFLLGVTIRITFTYQHKAPAEGLELFF